MKIKKKVRGLEIIERPHERIKIIRKLYQVVRGQMRKSEFLTKYTN